MTVPIQRGSTCDWHVYPPGLGSESDWEWTWQMASTRERRRCAQCGEPLIWVAKPEVTQ